MKEKFLQLIKEYEWNNRGLLADHYCDLMQQAYELGLNADKWVSVDDKTKWPNRSEHFKVLVWGSYTADCPRASIEVYFYVKGNKIEFRSSDGIKTKNVTHWQPLPTKPEIK